MVPMLLQQWERARPGAGVSPPGHPPGGAVYGAAGRGKASPEVVRRMRGWFGFVIRLVVSAVVLLLLAAILPGFRIAGFWFALLAAVVIAVLGWVVEALFGRRVSPQGRGIVGFLVSAVVIYLAQFLVPGMQVSVWGALLASLVIGIVDAFVPTELR